MMKKVFLLFFSILLNSSVTTDAFASSVLGERVSLTYGMGFGNRSIVAGSVEVSFSMLSMTGVTLTIGDTEYDSSPGKIDLPYGTYDVVIKYFDSILYKEEIKIVAGSMKMTSTQVCSYPKSVMKYKATPFGNEDVLLEYQVDHSGKAVAIEIISSNNGSIFAHEHFRRLSEETFCPWARDGKPHGETKYSTAFEQYDKSNFKNEVSNKKIDREKAWVFGVFANRADIGL
jgi:hypothetical protein